MTTISIWQPALEARNYSSAKQTDRRVKAAAMNSEDREFLVIIALLMATSVLAINMILPAFDQITRHFNLPDTAQVGLTVSLLYAGLAFGQMVFGPLSDSIGRKGALTIGIGLFLAGCALSGAADTFEMLILGQIFQGLGLGAPRVLTLAILRDRFSGASMASAMSFVMVMFVLAPTFAPFIGQIIVDASMWRVLFIAFAMMGTGLLLLIWLRLPETLPSHRRQVISLHSSYLSYLDVLKSRQAVGHAIALGVISGPFIAYLNMSQQIFEFQYDLGTFYPIIFAALSLCIGAASFVNGKIVLHIGPSFLVILAMATIVTTSIIATIVLIMTGTSLPLLIFIAYIGIILFCFGLLVSNLNALAMADLADNAGAGAALVGALSTIISIPVAVLIGHFASQMTQPIVIGFLICGILSWSIHMFVDRKICT